MNDQMELVKPEPCAVPAIAQDPMSLLTMAVERGADVGTLERLSVLRDKFMAERAKTAYFEALSAFQRECPAILRNKAGHENRYNYAPLERIVLIAGPYLAKHGFSYQVDGVVTEGWVEAVITTTHGLGHREEKRFKVPADSKAGMSPQQKYGAAMTYAKRYAFCAAFGIMTADKDNDCPPGPEQSVTEVKAELWRLLKPVRGEEQNWTVATRWLHDELCLADDKRVQDLDAAGLREVIAKAKRHLTSRVEP